MGRDPWIHLFPRHPFWIFRCSRLTLLGSLLSLWIVLSSRLTPVDFCRSRRTPLDFSSSHLIPLDFLCSRRTSLDALLFPPSPFGFPFVPALALCLFVSILAFSLWSFFCSHFIPLDVLLCPLYPFRSFLCFRRAPLGVPAFPFYRSGCVLCSRLTPLDLSCS